MKILAADIGGTKTLIQLAEVEWANNTPHIDVYAEQRFDSSAYETFGQLIKDFFTKHKSLPYPEMAGIAVAGPIEETITSQQAKLTNLSWVLDGHELMHELHVGAVRLMNDFEATAYGTRWLSQSSLSVIQGGIGVNTGNCLVVGAGTGLGVCILVWNGSRYIAVPTEGGHVGFSPADEDQDYIHKSLRNLYGRTSAERVVSGPGIETIYGLLCEKYGISDGLTAKKGLAVQVTQLAKERPESISGKTLTVFTRCYGSFVGDVALSYLATGGVFIAGGIAPKIIWRLQQSDFIGSIRGKGRMERIVSKMPISVVMDEKVALFGALIETSRLFKTS